MTCRSCATQFPGECPECDEASLVTVTSCRVVNSIIAMRVADPEYWKKTLESRLSGGTGSTFFYGDSQELEEALVMCSWYPYDDPDVSDECEAFITHDLGGLIGVTPIDPEGQYRLADPKGTGKVSAVQVHATSEHSTAEFTVLIAGIEDGELRAFTVHPGQPIKASQVSGLGLENRVYSGQECLDMGLTHAKVQR